jgi:hypothetical protein
MSKVVTDGKTSMEDSLPERRGRAATSRAGVARKVAHLTPEESVARGKAARNEVPRSSHGAGSRPSTDPTLSGCSRSRA